MKCVAVIALSVLALVLMAEAAPQKPATDEEKQQADLSKVWSQLRESAAKAQAELYNKYEGPIKEALHKTGEKIHGLIKKVNEAEGTTDAPTRS